MPTLYRDEPHAAPALRARNRARTLRRHPTEAERLLWWALRHRLSPQSDTHFRRQVPLGPYFADFCSLKARLIIEVDGNQHGLPAELRRDAVRTLELERQGFTVLRFSNHDVLTCLDTVLDTILAALAQTPPTPSPSPHGGGERCPAP
ncbi:endonuclease domain-containing protein [Enterovirga sp. CN4-39]|uniref:endonuclease domain-containing protein n=1 Tax=Enterovirga sp. CN4-39 TaxID=3400910 RepID=UPI003C0D6145